MRNSEVYAFIERMYDALHSGLPIEDCLDDTKNVVMDMEEEVCKQMRVEEEQKSGIKSNRFFNELAVSTDEEIIEFCERMEQVHPALGKFAKYLMEEDEPTFFILYGEDRTKAVGRSSHAWLYKVIRRIYNVLLTGGSLNDK